MSDLNTLQEILEIQAEKIAKSRCHGLTPDVERFLQEKFPDLRICPLLRHSLRIIRSRIENQLTGTIRRELAHKVVAEALKAPVNGEVI
jgi:hypothetical protein